ncbi:LuxR C-terminal-related transcriptional regulator [Actinomadura terrae]|uniref:LuxR C-terminal-related transcriptional regulator n=1 Tax=Actinomadura terrae TaxID=604353 RepID=UPI001FA72D58|nr:LuxR C-terminal-related transcriptional regulator [Actinomadura terrae]
MWDTGADGRIAVELHTDNPLSLLGLTAVLEKTPGIDVVATSLGDRRLSAAEATTSGRVVVVAASSGAAGLALARRLLLGRPAAGPAEAVAPAEQAGPASPPPSPGWPRVVLMLDCGGDLPLVEASRLQLRGVLCLREGLNTIEADLRCVEAGGVTVSPCVAGQMFLGLARACAARPAAGVPRRLDRLSMRERQVYELLVRGHSTKEVARVLTVTEVTIRSHVRRILAKLEMRNRAELVVPPDDEPFAPR